MMNDFYRKNAREIFSTLETDEKGLAQAEAKKRLEKNGANKLETKKGTPKWKLFLFQFKDVFMILFIIAAAMSFFI